MAERTNMTDELDAAEGLIAAGETERAAELLERVAEDAEEYVDRNCVTTDEVQWFSFPTLFERLCYRRVEKDPRELHDVGEPLDRLYADLAFALVHEGDYAAATEALKRAVRWNPMGCGYRLDLAELYRTNGDLQEYLALTYSVFERASDVRHLVRAFCNFARHFLETGQEPTAAAALHAARRLDWRDPVLDDLLAKAKGTPADPDSVTDDQAQELLGEQGLPDGANAEVALCLLMCATDVAAMGNRNLATTLTVRARDLVGAPAVKALLELIRDADSDGAHAEKGTDDAGTNGVPGQPAAPADAVSGNTPKASASEEGSGHASA